MGVLDSLLRYRAYKDQQMADSASAIPAAVNAFIVGKQQSTNNALKMLELQGGLATKGIVLDPNSPSGFRRDESLRDPLDEMLKQSLFVQRTAYANLLDQKPEMMQQQQAQKDLKAQQDMEKGYINNVQGAIRSNRMQYGSYNTMVENAWRGIDRLEKTRNPQTGELNPPPALHTELAMTAGRLLNGTTGSNISENVINGLKQKTLKEQAAQLAIWLGQDPKVAGGTTASNAQFLYDTIKDLGTQSQNARDKVIQDVVGMPPSDLEQSRVDRIKNKQFGRDFVGYVNGLGSNDTKSFNSTDEADNAGLPSGTIVSVGGRRYQI